MKLAIIILICLVWGTIMFYAGAFWQAMKGENPNYVKMLKTDYNAWMKRFNDLLERKA